MTPWGAGAVQPLPPASLHWLVRFDWRSTPCTADWLIWWILKSRRSLIVWGFLESQPRCLLTNWMWGLPDSHLHCMQYVSVRMSVIFKCFFPIMSLKGRRFSLDSAMWVQTFYPLCSSSLCLCLCHTLHTIMLKSDSIIHKQLNNIVKKSFVHTRCAQESFYVSSETILRDACYVL